MIVIQHPTKSNLKYNEKERKRYRLPIRRHKHLNAHQRTKVQSTPSWDEFHQLTDD